MFSKTSNGNIHLLQLAVKTCFPHRGDAKCGSALVSTQNCNGSLSHDGNGPVIQQLNSTAQRDSSTFTFIFAELETNAFFQAGTFQRKSVTVQLSFSTLLLTQFKVCNFSEKPVITVKPLHATRYKQEALRLSQHFQCGEENYSLVRPASTKRYFGAPEHNNITKLI